MGALIDYLDTTQKGRLPLLQRPVREDEAGAVQIDAATRRNLELTRSLAGGREGSLLAVIDRTVTPAGARLLEQRLSSPSRDLEVVQSRLADGGLRAGRPRAFARICARRCARHPTSTGRCPDLRSDRGGPRDLAAIRTGIAQAAHPFRALRRQRPAGAADDGAGESRRPRRSRRPARNRAGRRPAAPGAAMAASSPPVSIPISTRRARCATRVARSSPGCRRAMPRRPASLR